jgi:hypothetical protein
MRLSEHTNPYRSPDDRLHPTNTGDFTPTTGVALLAITVTLLLAAVTLSLLQKRWEGRAAIGVATQLPTAAVADDINRAKVAQVIGVATASVAIATWVWAFYRKESNLVLHLSVLTLLTIFVLLQLLMV